MNSPLIRHHEHSRHLKSLFYWALILIALIELILFRLAFSRYDELGWARCLWTFLISSGIPLGILIRLLVKVRPVVFARYNLYENQLNVDSGSRHMVLKFNDLYEVSFDKGWSRFFQGYRLKHQSGQVVRIFSTLEKSEEILNQIQRQRPGMISDSSLETYKRRVRFHDISWSRLFERMKAFKLLFIHFVILPLFFSGLTWWFYQPVENLGFDLKWLDWFLLALLGHFVVVLLLNSLEERIVYLFYSKKILEPGFQRDLKLERIIRILFQVIYLSLSLGFALFLILRGGA